MQRRVRRNRSGLQRDGWLARGLAAVAVSLVLALGVLSQSAAAATTSITLKPSVGPPTTKVAIHGAGFGASEGVNVYFSLYAYIKVAGASTTSTGSFSTTFIVPKAALPGNHTVTAIGKTSGRSASHSFLVRTDWPKVHFDNLNSGYNPYENVIGPSNVSGLKTAWTGSVGQVGWSSPAVSSGVVYIGSNNRNLYAFSATGAGCSGTPTTCTPLWTGTTDSGLSTSSPAVANGVVYIGSNTGKLYAFSASATTNCSGTPKTCAPLWVGTTDGTVTSPTVANGVVYVGTQILSGPNVYAFSATGTTNCSGTPKTCNPLWTAQTGNFVDAAPAVADGFVYVAAEQLYAFSASGTAYCAGSPKTCQPVWTAFDGEGTIANPYGSPAVSNDGVVYVGTDDGQMDSLYAFDAYGSTGPCLKAVCSPLWTAATGPLSSSPAVASGMVYIGSGNGKLYAFTDSYAGGSHCSGTPKACTPLWTAAIHGNAGNNCCQSSAAVANGVVYIGSEDGKLNAFSASGTTNCSGTPKTCTALWTGTTGKAIDSSPAVVNGVVYVGSQDGNLYAFSH